MKFLTRSVLALVLLAAHISTATELKKPSVNQLVDQHYAELLGEETFVSKLVKRTHPPRDCESTERSCTDVACEKLGQFGCDELSEIKAVNRACRGNHDGACLGAACDRMGIFGCDEISEVQKVARACVGNYDLSCFEDVCNRLGQFGCDELSEVEEVLRSCSGN